MLDHDDGDAARGERSNDGDDVADLGRIEPREHFVEQEQPWLSRQRACELEPLSSGDSQSVSGTIKPIAQADIVADLFGQRQRRLPGAVPQMCADQNIVAHRQAGEGLHDLEGPRDAAAREAVRRLTRYVFAVVADMSGAGLKEAGNHGK